MSLRSTAALRAGGRSFEIRPGGLLLGLFRGRPRRRRLGSTPGRRHVQTQQRGQNMVGRPARERHFPGAMIMLINDCAPVREAGEERITRCRGLPCDFATTCGTRERVDIRLGGRMRASECHKTGDDEKHGHQNPRVRPTARHAMHPPVATGNPRFNMCPQSIDWLVLLLKHLTLKRAFVEANFKGAFFAVRVIGPVDNFLVARALRLGVRRSAAIGRSRPSFP